MSDKVHFLEITHNCIRWADTTSQILNFRESLLTSINLIHNSYFVFMMEKPKQVLIGKNTDLISEKYFYLLFRVPNSNSSTNLFRKFSCVYLSKQNKDKYFVTKMISKQYLYIEFYPSHFDTKQACFICCTLVSHCLKIVKLCKTLIYVSCSFAFFNLKSRHLF